MRRVYSGLHTKNRRQFGIPLHDGSPTLWGWNGAMDPTWACVPQCVAHSVRNVQKVSGISSHGSSPCRRPRSHFHHHYTTLNPSIFTIFSLCKYSLLSKPDLLKLKWCKVITKNVQDHSNDVSVFIVALRVTAWLGRPRNTALRVTALLATLR